MAKKKSKVLETITNKIKLNNVKKNATNYADHTGHAHYRKYGSTQIN